jgi:uncharacterized phosphatase
MPTFYLIRHAEPEWSLNQRLKLKGSQRDFVPLTDKGIQQAINVAKELHLKRAEIVVSSPFTRALHTASIICRELSLPIKVEYGLHEWIPDLTLEYDSFEKVLELANDFTRNNGSYPNDGSRLWETKDSMIKRAKESLRNYINFSRVIIVPHEMIIKSITGTNIDEIIQYCQIIERSSEAIFE